MVIPFIVLQPYLTILIFNYSSVNIRLRCDKIKDVIREKERKKIHVCSFICTERGFHCNRVQTYKHLHSWIAYRDWHIVVTIQNNKKDEPLEQKNQTNDAPSGKPTTEITTNL